MSKLITGLHHITALSSSAQENYNFYAGILGLRMVKKTINFDAPEVYHLYYGNEGGSPGTIMTFFPYEGMPKGRKGKGQLTVTSFSAPKNALDYWIKRLNKFKIAHREPAVRFDDEIVLYFEDFDGLGLEIVFNLRDKRKGFTYGNIPLEYAIQGFYGITLSEDGYEKTAGLLTAHMDHDSMGEKGNRFRYTASGKPGDFVDILCTPDLLTGLSGAGTIHHVAFATENESTQLIAREKLKRAGLNITPVLDREYFHSVYFREPGGVLFEIATLPPGFTIDEELAHLGEALKLPPWEEKNRKFIESCLPVLHPDLKKYKD
jgi:glyoxalase family protein